MKIEDVWNKFKTFTMKEPGVMNKYWSIPAKPLNVISYDVKNNQQIQRKIKFLFRQYITENLREIILENNSRITITYNHALLTMNGWTPILNIGDNVYVIDGSYVKIVDIKIIPCNDFVYDLNISKHHNFFANDILCHNTCAAINIAENFKEQVQKYNTKIYVLVPGPNIKESWKGQLITCTGSTYTNYIDKNTYISKTGI